MPDAGGTIDTTGPCPDRRRTAGRWRRRALVAALLLAAAVGTGVLYRCARTWARESPPEYLRPRIVIGPGEAPETDPAGQPAPFRAGVGRVDISPPPGVELSGYGPRLGRRATGVLDPLYAKALLLETSAGRALLVVCDLIGVSAETTAAVRRLAYQRLGVPPHRTWVAATHTHSGPASIRLWDWGEPDPAYVEALPEKILEAASQAERSLAPARLGCGRAPVSGIGHNRVVKDGPVDRCAGLVRIDTTAGRPLALLVNFGAHPVVHAIHTGWVSADYPGQVCRTLEAHFPGATAFFLQGASGDVNAAEPAEDIETGQQRAAAIGRRVAEQVIRPLEAIETRADLRLRAGRLTAMLPHLVSNPAWLRRHQARWSAEEAQAAIGEAGPAPDSRLARIRQAAHEQRWVSRQFQMLRQADAAITPADLGAVQLNEAVLVFVPGELFVRLGMQLQASSPGRVTLVVTLADGAVGYIPTREPYALHEAGVRSGRGLYEAFAAPKLYGRMPFREDVGDLLTARAVDLIAAVTRGD